jgi:hypothetical protein
MRSATIQIVVKSHEDVIGDIIEDIREMDLPIGTEMRLGSILEIL